MIEILDLSGQASETAAVPQFQTQLVMKSLKRFFSGSPEKVSKHKEKNTYKH